ncbi:S24/S26 family peptidase [Streptomyces peucetius]
MGAALLIGTRYTTIIINGNAMDPTYSPGDRVFLERTDVGAVRQGDVVLYQTGDRYEGRACSGV